MRRFTKRMKTAIRQYYTSRKANFVIPKDKCLDAIFAARKGNRIRAVTAMAGTFWMYWPDGVQTTHNEKNWWRMKILRSNSSILRTAN